MILNIPLYMSKNFKIYLMKYITPNHMTKDKIKQAAT